MVKAAKSNHPPKRPAVTSPLSTTHCSQTTCQPVPPQQRQSAQQPASAAVDIRNIVQREEAEEEEEGEREKIKGTNMTNPPVIEELDTSTANREGGEDNLILDDSDVPPLI